MNDICFLWSVLNTLSDSTSDFSEVINGYKVDFSNNENELKLKISRIEDKENFDDTEIKEDIARYKENIEKIEDCLFVEIMDDFSKVIDLKDFDELLSKEHFTSEEANQVAALICLSKTYIREHILNRIEDLKELVEIF